MLGPDGVASFLGVPTGGGVFWGEEKVGGGGGEAGHWAVAGTIAAAVDTNRAVQKIVLGIDLLPYFRIRTRE
jgi:hypothetical protein